MNVFKRCACPENCDHRYQFKFKHRGVPYQESTRTKNFKLACQIAERRKREIVGKTAGVTTDDHRKVRLSAARAQYDEWVVGAHADPDKSKRIIASFCAFFNDDPFLADLEAFDCERWRRAQLKDGLARSTVKSYFGLVQGFFRQTAIWYPSLNRRDTGVKTWRLDDPPIAIFEDDELQVVLTAMPPVLALVSKITMRTLARLGEIAGLTIHDVGPDWLSRRLKGGKRLRVPIPVDLAQAIKAQVTRPAQERIFENLYRGRWQPVQRNALSNRYYKWFRRHQRPHFHHHCFRHTGISRMLARGEDPKTIMLLAGWTTLQMLPRYGHVGDKQLRAAVERNSAALEAILSGPSPAVGATGGDKKGDMAAGQARKSLP